MARSYNEILATLDCWGRPTEKLPNCPICDKDELGVNCSGQLPLPEGTDTTKLSILFCHYCGWSFEAQ